MVAVPAVGDGDEGLDAAVEVAVHEIGGADEDLRVPVFGEGEDSRMLEVAAEDRPDCDVLRQPGHTRPQRADATDLDVDLGARLRGAVEGIDDLLVDEGVDLDLDPGLLARLRVSCLAVDALDESGADGA